MSRNCHHRADTCQVCQEELDLTIALICVLGAILIGVMLYIFLTKP